MRLTRLLAMLAIAGVANAQSATGPGSLIPAAGTGGGSTYPTLPPSPGSSDAFVLNGVTGVSSIEVQGLAHTYIGDVQMVLWDPDGVGHLIFLRPGYLNPGSFGNSGNFGGGTYTFVESGGGSLPSTSTPGVDPPAGTYNQTFDSGGVAWIDGDQGVLNTPMGSIAGPRGTWTLQFYDWAGGDTGSFIGWTMNYTTDDPGTPYCFGDSLCPCGNTGAFGNGCANGVNPDGAQLTGVGVADVTKDSLLLSGAGLQANQAGIFFQGTATSPLFLFDGLRCADGVVIRLATVVANATGDSDTRDLEGTISTIGMVSAGDLRHYQLWYRNPMASPCATGANTTNAYSIQW